jgi:hypothetical protein
MDPERRRGCAVTFHILFSEQLPLRSGSYPDVTGMVDAAGNHYFCYVWEHPENNNVTEGRILKLYPNGQQQTFAQAAPDGYKIARMDSARSGRFIVLDAVGHSHLPEPTPRSRVGMSVAVDVGFVTTPQFEAEEGGAGAFVGDGQPPQPPQEAGMTKDEFVLALNTPNDPLAVALGKTIKNKSREAISTEKVLTENNGQHYFYQFYKDRLYEVFSENVPGFWAWLAERVTRP